MESYARRRLYWALAIVAGLLVAGVAARLIWVWYQPWEGTYRVTSVDGQEVCLAPGSLDDSGIDTPDCFSSDLLADGTMLAPGDCVRLSFAYESLRIKGATTVVCPVST